MQEGARPIFSGFITPTEWPPYSPELNPNRLPGLICVRPKPELSHEFDSLEAIPVMGVVPIIAKNSVDHHQKISRIFEQRKDKFEDLH